MYVMPQLKKETWTLHLKDTKPLRKETQTKPGNKVW